MKNEDRIVKNLLQLGVFLYKTSNKMTEVYGLNQQQFILLNEIVSRQQVTQKQLVADLLLEKSNVSKIVKKLKKTELIVVDTSIQDRRTTIVRSTGKGKEVWHSCMRTLCDWNRQWLSSISGQEKEKILNALESLKKLVHEDTRSY